ncbi:MAG TPA: hypothetical protein VGL28_02395 [Steroidobacteraceae bacterium]
MRLSAIDRAALLRLLADYGLTLRVVAPGEAIPGSYWGESEAGLRGNLLFARLDTPVHSILHEACHYVCMRPQRRIGLNRDAGGDDAEESAVCYLQILLAGELGVTARSHICGDMDRWGYSFRLGSATAWFQQDAADSRAWLLEHGLIDEQTRPLRALRR